jgi:hypothetical protein
MGRAWLDGFDVECIGWPIEVDCGDARVAAAGALSRLLTS